MRKRAGICLLLAVVVALLLASRGHSEPAARLTPVSPEAVPASEPAVVRPIERPIERLVGPAVESRGEGPAERPAAEPTSEPPAPPPLAAQLPPETGELLDAYEQYWEIYAEALLLLDGSRLGEVMTGPRLERAIREVERLRRSGRAVRIVVARDPLVAAISGDEATIVDQYENGSYLVDPLTREAVADRGDPETIRTVVSLVREPGGWKVHESKRQETP